MAETPELKRWVLDLVRERYGNVAGRLSTRIGMSQGAFSRGLEKGTLKTENLLRLAIETGESPSTVLRMANKEAEATLIERCYGAPRRVSPVIRDVIALLEELPEEAGPMTVRSLEAFRAAWRGLEAQRTAPAAGRVATTSTRPKRAARVR